MTGILSKTQLEGIASAAIKTRFCYISNWDNELVMWIPSSTVAADPDYCIEASDTPATGRWLNWGVIKRNIAPDFTPYKLGSLFLDTSTGTFYGAVGTSSVADWVAFGTGSS